MDANRRELLLKDEVYRITGCAMEVLNSLGHGLLEKPYENALVVEFGLQLTSVPHKFGTPNTSNLDWNRVGSSGVSRFPDFDTDSDFDYFFPNRKNGQPNLKAGEYGGAGRSLPVGTPQGQLRRFRALYLNPVSTKSP